MISELTTSLPRRLESFKLVVLDFVVETADGKLANFLIPNNSGRIVANFTKVGATPRTTTGPIEVTDGAGTKVIEIADADIQIEQGEAVVDWPGVILGSIVVKGVDVNNELWAGRSTGVAEGDPTSIHFEFGKSDKNTLPAQTAELEKWVKDKERGKPTPQAEGESHEG